MEHTSAISRPWATVIDIGANRGQFALAVRASSAFSNIVAFEPLPAPAAVFRTVFRDDKRTRLVQAAVGETSTCRIMHVSGRDDSSSLLQISARQEAIFPGTGQASTITVSVGPLSNFVDPTEIKTPALLKLDVQGFELQALVGCEAFLGQFDFVYCECSFVELYSGQALAPEVIRWLDVRDFHLCGVFNTSFDKNGQPVQADLLFRRQ